MAWDFRPQPQTRKEFVKNEKRIRDLVAKCAGDKNQEISKARTMANSIDTPEKAYNRGHVARELGYEHIFDVFYSRAFELGSVTKAEHRDYQIEQILDDDTKTAPLYLTECPNLSKYDNTHCVEMLPSSIPPFIIKNIAEIIRLTVEANFDKRDMSDEDEKHEHEGLLKRLTFNRIKKMMLEEPYSDCELVETRNADGSKMYNFQMDSDSLRYACEINLGANGYDYFRVD